MTRALAERNLEDFGNQAKVLFEDAVQKHQPLLVTRDGKSHAVLMGYDVYEEEQNRLQILMALAKGEMEIARDEGHDLEDVMAEAKAILNA